MTAPGVGELVREWRSRRHRSQLDLAVEVGVSARHLSFVETGRSRPSPELVLALARHLDVPLRERNALLLAAGYAPRYGETPLDAPAMSRVRAAVQQMLDAHDPYPGLLLDRHWNVVAANDAVAKMVAGLPLDLLSPPINLFRLGLHPDGLAGRTRNFPEWGAYLLTQLDRLVARTGDPGLDQVNAEVRQYPNVSELTANAGWADFEETPLLVPFCLDYAGSVLSFFTTLTAFGTPTDVTVEGLAVELFFPLDDETAEILNS